jgi:hypothetical protein
MSNEERVELTPTRWQRVAEIPDFPFSAFRDLQKGINERRYSLGVDSLAAAELASRFSSKLGNLVIKLLSLLLCAIMLFAVASAIWLHNYWLLAGVPIIAVMFFVSTPAARWRRAVTVAGALAVLLSLDLWLREEETLAYLVGFAAITFIAVRLAGYITRTSLCEAIMESEELFLYMYERAICTVRDNRSGAIWINQEHSEGN